MVHFRFTTIIVIVHRDFYRVIYSVRVCIPHYDTCYFCDNRMSKVRYRIASGIISGKYIGFGLNGTERTTIVVEILMGSPMLAA